VIFSFGRFSLGGGGGVVEGDVGLLFNSVVFVQKLLTTNIWFIPIIFINFIFIL
jgi:hypothetical protein